MDTGLYRGTKAGGRWFRIGAADPKIVIAGAFAGLGLLWAVVSIAGTMRERAPENAGPAVLEGAFDERGNAVESDYSKASSRSQIEHVVNQLGVVLNAQSGALLRSMETPVGTPEALAQSVSDAFAPILSGDHGDFVSAIRALGGVLSEDLDGEHPLFTHLSKRFTNAQVDLSRISVRRHEPRQGGMRRVVEEEGEGSGRNVNEQTMEINPQGVFPDAPGDDDPSAVEVRIPVKPKGEKNESVFGLVLTWNAQAMRWQPAAYRMTTITVTEEKP